MLRKAQRTPPIISSCLENTSASWGANDKICLEKLSSGGNCPSEMQTCPKLAKQQLMMLKPDLVDAVEKNSSNPVLIVKLTLGIHHNGVPRCNSL